MQLTVFITALLSAASVTQARLFFLYDEVNFGGQGHWENKNNGPACWNLNGVGDKASSVRGDDGCTTFFRERDCTGSSWQNRGNAPTVPSFLNDHIWSYRNQC